MGTFAPAVYTTEVNGRNYAVAQFANEFEFVSPDRPAVAGDRITLVAAGLGPVFPPLPDGQPLVVPHLVPVTSNLKLFLDGKEIPIESAAMRTLGTFEVTFTLPAGIAGDVSVELKAGGESSQPGPVLATAPSPQN